MNEATQRYLDYVRRTGGTGGVEDALGDLMRYVEFDEVAEVLGLKLEQTTFDKTIPQEFAYVMASGYEVVSWSSGEAGAGIPPTQVHVILQILDMDAKLVLRLKSAVACDQLIRILKEHREYVWGKPRK